MANQIKLLRKESYRKLVEKLSEQQQVYGPVKEGKRLGYRRITSFDQLTTDFILPELSAKSFVFPAMEKLFGFTSTKESVDVQDIDLDKIAHKVILGVRPCDAAGIKKLAATFEWEPADPIFAKRLERTTLIGYACTQADEYCFCTSLNGGPGSTEGSDILLTQTDTGDYIAEINTPKGEAIVALAPELFEQQEGLNKEKYLANVPKRFEEAGLEAKMKAAFDTDVFDKYAVRCLGCSACAYVCPVCACFDIQDESKGQKGQRMRCWDSCGAKLFTLHTSGHNPRETQGARWRQRIMHKFSYMPERLGVNGCVGCGRCTRRCPVDMNIAECIEEIAR